MAEGRPAALPWAANQASGADVKPVQDTHAPTASSEGDLLTQAVSIQQVGLEPGARIEVCVLSEQFHVLVEQCCGSLLCDQQPTKRAGHVGGHNRCWRSLQQGECLVWGGQAFEAHATCVLTP